MTNHEDPSRRRVRSRLVALCLPLLLLTSACSNLHQRYRFELVDGKPPARVVVQGTRPQVEVLNQGPGTIQISRAKTGPYSAVRRAGATTVASEGAFEVHLRAAPGERAWVRIEIRGARTSRTEMATTPER